MREAIRDRGRLEHMITAIDNVFEFMEGKTVSDLKDNKLLFFGVVKNIEIIGEAAYKLTSEFTMSHPDVPWRYIVKMRHILVHGYYQVSAKEVWSVVQNDLQPLRKLLQQYMSEMQGEE